MLNLSHIKIQKKKRLEKPTALVGLTEFESVTSCPPDKHANQLRYSPNMTKTIAQKTFLGKSYFRVTPRLAIFLDQPCQH